MQSAGFGLCICIVATVVLSARPVGQDPAPPRDDAPFERPRSLCTLVNRDATDTFKALLGLLKQHQFEVRRMQTSEGWLEAWRTDEKRPDDSDRLLLWIERDFQRPTEATNLHLKYGRFMKLFGVTEAVRVKVSDAEETKRIGKLRGQLLELCQ
jgi:hypothetical protein